MSGGTIGENARVRYRVRAGQTTRGIPVPRTSQLPTNPILAAPAERSADRRISAGFIVEAATGAPVPHTLRCTKRRTTPHARSGVLDNHPVISTTRVLPRGTRRTQHIQARTPDAKAQRHLARRTPRRQQPLVSRHHGVAALGLRDARCQKGRGSTEGISFVPLRCRGERHS